ncbi:MAG: metalloregulator ArsR/SmtB family transcription factor [Phycisphaeraceae bacterium]
MTTSPLSILTRMTVLADAVRCRAMRVLERQELTVAELCAVLQLPQSTASRHLRLLAEGGFVVSRREGTATIYRLRHDDLDPPARKLWLLVREQIAAPGSSSVVQRDELRLQRVLADRQTRSQAFFSSSAGQWDHLRHELFGDRFDLLALPALLDAGWTVGDIGCGTGQMTEMLAPFVKRVVAVDNSAAMLKACRKRLARFKNVELRRGEVTALPIDDAALDVAVVMLVLHHLPAPEIALKELARVIKTSGGGKLLLVDMLPHDHVEYQQTMGHQHLGFAPRRMTAMLKDAGFDRVNIQPLPTETNTKGPALFVAAACRSC